MHFSPGWALSSYLWIKHDFDVNKLVQQKFDAFTKPAWNKNWSLLKPNLFSLPNRWHHSFFVLLLASETPEWHFLSGLMCSLQNTCRFNIFMVHNQSFRILTITSLLRVWEHSKQSCFQREGKYLCTKPSDLLTNVELPPPPPPPHHLQAHSQVILLLD